MRATPPQPDQPGQPGQAAQGGCLMVFGLPFALAGATIFLQGFFDEAQRSEPLWVIACAGLIFFGSGIGLTVYGWRLSRSERAATKLQTLHPDQPWMWRPEWTTGRISSDQRQGLVTGWVFASFWNAISALLLKAAWEDWRDEPFWPLVMLFPLIGVLLLLWAVMETLRSWRHGQAWFEIQDSPGVIGGRLRGRIVTQLPQAPVEGVVATLTALRVSHSSDSTSEKVVWQTRQTLSRAQLGREAGGIVLPIDFSIPADAKASDESAGGQFRWRLSVNASTPGVDFAADFLVPVFAVAGREQPSSGFGAKTQASAPSSPSPFVQRPRADGAVETYLPAGRNPGAAAGLTIFLVLWSAVLGVMLHLEAPWFFIVLWALFTLLLAWIALELWFGAAQIWFEGDEIVVRRTLFGMGKPRRIPVRDVKRVSVDIGMSQSRTMTQQAQAWYDVNLHQESGRSLVAASSIRDQGHAERLAAMIRAELDKRPR